MAGVLMAAALAGCRTSEPAAAPTLSGAGVVKYVDLEGGFYGIVGDDGSRLYPVNLAEAYHRDGLRVRYRARELKDVLTTRMWGVPVELISVDVLR